MLSWFILCFLNYLQNDLSHKKVQTCSLCLWSLTFVNLSSALNGYERSMKIMRQCLCFWVFNGNRPATVCLFCALGFTHLQVSNPMRDSVSVQVSMWQGVWGMGGGHPVADRAVTPSVWDEPCWERSEAGDTTAQSHTASFTCTFVTGFLH